jgi:hypothetical protein
MNKMLENPDVAKTIDILRLAKAVANERSLVDDMEIKERQLHIYRALDKFINDLEAHRFKAGKIRPLCFLLNPDLPANRWFALKARVGFGKRMGWNRRSALAYVDNLVRGVLALDEDGNAPADTVWTNLVDSLNQISERVYGSKLKKGYRIKLVVNSR